MTDKEIQALVDDSEELKQWNRTLEAKVKEVAKTDPVVAKMYQEYLDQKAARNVVQKEV